MSMALSSARHPSPGPRLGHGPGTRVSGPIPVTSRVKSEQAAGSLAVTQVALCLVGAAGQELGPVALAPIAITTILVARGLLRRDAMPGLFWGSLGVYVLMLSSGLLSGGISGSDLISAEFYMTDGRVFFYYLPLIGILTLPAGSLDLGAAVKAVNAIGMVHVGLMVAWLLGVGRAALGGPLFTGFMSHKTSAGTFFSAIALFLLMTGWASHRRLPMLTGAALVPAVLFAGSRQAFAAVASAVVLYAVLSARRTLRVRLIVLFGVAAVALPFISPTSYARVTQGFTDESFTAAGEQWAGEGWNPAKELGGQLVLGREVDWNVVGRIAYYRRGISLWRSSPLVGVGFARYNDDLSPGCEGGHVPALACVPGTSERFMSDKSAHNSLLHIGAELGLVGVGAFVLLWVAIVRRLRRLRRLPSDPLDSAAVEAAFLAVLSVPASSLFGHALGAPQVGLPILTLVAIAIATTGPVKEFEEDRGRDARG